MSQDPKTSNMKLGAFVAAGTILLAMALFYMGQQRSMFRNTIPLSVVFSDVEGLQEGNNVQFMGMNVGTVKKIVILSPTAMRVDIHIKEEIRDFIKTDAVAQIGTEGLMGNKIIRIKTTSSEAPAVQAGYVLQSNPGIAMDSLFQSLQLTSKHAEKLAKNLSDITTQLQGGQGVVGSLLMDSLLDKKLTKTIDQLQATSIQTHLMMTDLHQIVRQVNQGHGPVGMLLTDTLLSNDLKEAVGQIKMLSRQSAQLSTELLKVSQQMNSGQGMAQTLLTDTALVVQVEQSLAEIKQGSERFNENMQALQHNFLLRRYFRKKAKQ